MSSSTDRLRGVSRHIYGNSYFLEVSAAIAVGPESFTQKSVADATNLEKNLIGTVLTRLEKAGLVERMDPSGREKPFRRLRSSFWNAASTHLAEFA